MGDISDDFVTKKSFATFLNSRDERERLFQKMDLDISLVNGP